MEKNTFFLVFLLLFVSVSFFACNNNKDKAELTYTITAYKGTLQNNEILPNTSLYFYKSEEDLLTDQNILFTQTTDASGVYSKVEVVEGIKNSTELNEYYYVDAKKGNLNRKRYYKDNGPDNYTSLYDLFNKVSSGKNGKDKEASGDLKLYLSSTPTKLRIIVYNSGTPQANAIVKLYNSEASYNSDITDNSPDPETGVVLPYSKNSDSNGEVYFDNLEPKKYWIRVTKGSLSNSSGTISTDGVLADDENLTNQLSIGIN